MNYFIRLTAVFGLACGIASSLVVTDPLQAQDNVVVIISDDAGWADYGFMRNADSAADPGNSGVVPTPNLDILASKGVTFTNAYTGSVCSPSRAMITTGQYGGRFGYGSNTLSSTVPINTTNIPQGLPTEITTAWERMQSVGYDTAAVGKWHIGEHTSGGGQLGNRPQHQGVEEFRGLLGGSRDYFDGNGSGSGLLRTTLSDGAGNVSSDNVDEGTFGGQYVTDIFGDQSVDYIKAKAGGADPFFLYSSFTAPHTPMQATAPDLAFIDSLGDPGLTGNRRIYAAMQYAMDRNIGKILDALEDPAGDGTGAGNDSDNILDDTLIIFMNDNGGDCCDGGPNSSDNGDLRNGKGSQFEGGMRVPMIVAGAGVDLAQQGSVSSDLVHSVDIVPTAYVGAGGGSFGPGDVVDGENLLPFINNTSPGVAHDNLFISRYNNQQSAVRMGKWKYMYQNGTGYQLYDLDVDIDESNNVVNQPANEAVVQQAHELLASYHVQMDKPRHDNQADDTNQFDHFRFREDALSSAAFSSSNAWTNGDTGSGSFTASWRDGYANNELTFRAKASGSYTITNDLNSVAGFSYMASKLNLANATAVLNSSESGTINGQPLMISNDLSGNAPEINLDATDATADQFTFNVDLDIEIYDHLTIQGNGNQIFHINGELREFRDGRNVTKSGTSNLTLGGGVDISGTFDVQGGKVAINNGQFNGNLIAQTSSSIIVGGVGFNETTGPPVGAPIVTAGLELNYDASQDISGDGIWSDTVNNQNLSFSGPASTIAVNDATFPSISAAYNIPTTGGAEGLGSNYFESTGASVQRSREDGTFEVWFHVSNTSSGGDQVLFEAGGAGRGLSFQLDDNLLSFNVNGDADTFSITETIGTGWHQAVGVIDLVGTSDNLANDSISLYVDNVLVGTLSNLLIDDWSGGNTSGIGEFASSLGAGGSPIAYHNNIASVRYYETTAFGATEVNQNWLAAMFDPGGSSVIPTELSIDGDYTQMDGAHLEIDLLDTTDFDSVSVTGVATIDGILDVKEISGFNPNDGDVFTILSATGGINGQFDTVNLPALSGLGWYVQYLANEVVLNVISFPPEDLNQDGFVDGLDLGILLGNWGQNGVGLSGGNLDGIDPVDGLDLGILLGAWNPPPAQAAQAVPEPCTVVGVVIYGCLISCLRVIDRRHDFKD